MSFIFLKTISNDIPSFKLVNEGIFVIAKITAVKESSNIYPIYEYTFKVHDEFYSSTSLNNNGIDIKLGDKFWALVLEKAPQNSVSLAYKGKINNTTEGIEIDKGINIGKIVLGNNYGLPLFLLVITFILFPYLVGVLHSLFVSIMPKNE